VKEVVTKELPDALRPDSEQVHTFAVYVAQEAISTIVDKYVQEMSEMEKSVDAESGSSAAWDAGNTKALPEMNSLAIPTGPDNDWGSFSKDQGHFSSIPRELEFGEACYDIGSSEFDNDFLLGIEGGTTQYHSLVSFEFCE
jgi:hypothetical protein